MVKNLPVNAGDSRDAGSIPGLGRSPEVGNGNPLQYSCLGNPVDRRAWRATVHRVTKSRTPKFGTKRSLGTFRCHPKEVRIEASPSLIETF